MSGPETVGFEFTLDSASAADVSDQAKTKAAEFDYDVAGLTDNLRQANIDWFATVENAGDDMRSRLQVETAEFKAETALWALVEGRKQTKGNTQRRQG
jgi:hypothetical protein